MCNCYTLFLLLFLLFSTTCFSQQNLLDSDNWNGTNGTALHTYNTNWVSPGSSCCNGGTIQQTPGMGTTGVFEADAIRNGFTWTPDQWVQANLDATNLSSVDLVCLRRSTGGSGTAANGYCAGVDNSDFNSFYNVMTLTNNVLARITACNTTTVAAVGDQINFQVQGTTLKLVVTGTGAVTATCTDSTFSGTSTDPGFLILGTGTNQAVMHNWRAGSVGSTSTIHHLMTLGMGYMASLFNIILGPHHIYA